MSDKSSKDSDKMPTAEQARELLIRAAGPRDLSAPSVKAMLGRAATRLGIGMRRARAIYHREARLIGADEWDAIKRAAAQHDITQEWGEVEHAALEIRLREAAPLPRRGPATGLREGAAAAQEGGRPRARAASRQTEG